MSKPKIPVDEKKAHKTFRLYPDDLDFLTELGEGSAQKGLDLAIEFIKGMIEAGEEA